MIATAGGVATNLVSRTWGTFPLNTSDWTILISFKYPSTPGAATNASVLNFFDGATDFSTPYLHLGSQVATGDLGLDIFVDGSHEFQSSFTAITNNAQNWAAVTYDASATTATLILNGTTIQSGAINLSAVVWDSCFVLGHGLADTTAPVSAAYLRAWQSILTTPQLTAEAASITPVITSTLLFTNPFQTSVDLTDHKLTAVNHFTAAGTVTTDTTDPLLSVMAGPPTNITANLATTVSADSAYFQDTLTVGAATDTWYKRACTTDGEWGAIAFGDLTTYKPTIIVYEGLANALTDTIYLDISNSVNLPIQFPVTAGNTYYFKAHRNGAVTPATAIISILDGLNLTAPIGSIAVIDDTVGFPLVLMDATTAYPIRFINPFPAGEGGNPLSNGTTLCVNIADSNCLLFPASLSSSTPVAVTTDNQAKMSSNETDTFIVAPVGGTYKLVSSTGVIDPTDFVTGAAVTRAVGLNVDASKAYYSDGGTSTGQAVKMWNLSTNAAGADLVAGVANYVINSDIIVLQDGTILVPRVKNTVTRNFTITRYNAAGAVQSTYDLGDNANNDNRIATDVSTANFWAWIKGITANSNAGFSIFKKIRESDGNVLLTTPTVPQYEGGVYGDSLAAATNTPIRFGHSESCPFWITRTVIGTVTETFPIRRQRRFLLPSSEDNKTVQIPVIELLMRTGIGLTPGAASDPPVLGSDPTIMVRLSKDGGKTWGQERTVSAGKIGEYLRRARLLRATGNYRNAVLEISVSDPVDWQFLAALAPNGVIEGSS